VAFITLQIDKKTDKINKIFFGRNTNPLHMAKTRNVMLLSSAGKGDDIEPFFLYDCHLDDKMKLSKRKLIFAPDPPADTSYHGWPATADHSRLPLSDKTPVRVHEDGKWRDYSYADDDGYLTSFGKGALYDIPEEEDELVEIVEDADQQVQTHLDSFYEMLYDPTMAETIIETDVNMILEQIKVELEDVVKAVKDKHLALALEKETAKGAV